MTETQTTTRGVLRRAAAQQHLKRLRDGEIIPAGTVLRHRMEIVGGLKAKPDPHAALHRASKVSTKGKP